MTLPNVSVIIPVHNSQQYINQCIDSVISQSLNNIEVIIIDDNSSDNSRNIINNYSINDNRIKFIYKNIAIGASCARNIGINVAIGEFIAFIDSDDIYPNKDVLKLLYAKAIENHAYICGGSLAYIDKNKNFLSKQLEKYQKFKFEGVITYADYQYDGGFYRFIYKNSFIKQNKLYFTENIRREDCLFFVQVMHTAKCFYAIPEYTYLYRKNHKQKIFDKNFMYQSLKCRNEIIKFAKHFDYTILYNQQKKGVINDIFTKFTLKNISFKSIKIIIILICKFIL